MNKDLKASEMERMTIFLDPDTFDRVEKACKREDRTRPTVGLRALLAYLDRSENTAHILETAGNEQRKVVA